MLDHKKMLEEIDRLVESDFLFSMEAKLIPHTKKYTQREAQEMVDILDSVYRVVHCLHCKACQTRYKVDKSLESD